MHIFMDSVLHQSSQVNQNWGLTWFLITMGSNSMTFVTVAGHGTKDGARSSGHMVPKPFKPPHPGPPILNQLPLMMHSL